MSADVMQLLARQVDTVLNQPKGVKVNGFVILVFPFEGKPGSQVNYVSNTDRKTMIVAMKEIIARFESRVQETGTVQ